MAKDIRIKISPVLLGSMGVGLVGFLKSPRALSNNGNREQETNNYAPDNGEKDQRLYDAGDSC